MEEISEIVSKLCNNHDQIHFSRRRIYGGSEYSGKYRIGDMMVDINKIMQKNGNKLKKGDVKKKVILTLLELGYERMESEQPSTMFTYTWLERIMAH